MKMIHLSPPPENMNSIRKACGIVRTHFWKSMGYWLTPSVWPRMTYGLQRPSECLADILCLLAKGWGTRCGGLWQSLLTVSKFINFDNVGATCCLPKLIYFIRICCGINRQRGGGPLCPMDVWPNKQEKLVFKNDLAATKIITWPRLKEVSELPSRNGSARVCPLFLVQLEGILTKKTFLG